MARRGGTAGWEARDDGACLLLARPGAARFDAGATEGWAAPAPRDPARFRAALAHQVRQDLWRALRDVRGFAPVVQVASAPDGRRLRLEVAAGGRLPERSPAAAQVRAAAAALLASGAHRARWQGFALRRAGGAAP